MGFWVIMTHDQAKQEHFKSLGCKVTPFPMARDDDRPWAEITIPDKVMAEIRPTQEDLPF